MCFVSWVQKTCKRHFNRVWYLSDFQLMALVIHLSLEILIEQGDVGLGGQFLNHGSPFLLISINALHWYRTHFDLPPLISMFEMIIISVFKYYYFTLWYNCEKKILTSTGEGQLKVCADQLRQVEDLKKVVTTEPIKGLQQFYNSTYLFYHITFSWES